MQIYLKCIEELVSAVGTFYFPCEKQTFSFAPLPQKEHISIKFWCGSLWTAAIWCCFMAKAISSVGRPIIMAGTRPLSTCEGYSRGLEGLSGVSNLTN